MTRLAKGLTGSSLCRHGDGRRSGSPSFSQEELKRIVETAGSVGILVTAHATSKEGMRRATLAGVATIEHGDGGDPEIFKLMAERGVALCPTLAALRHRLGTAAIAREPTLSQPASEACRE